MRMPRPLLAGLCLSVIAAPAADAHFGTFSLERRAGQYLIDIGYDVQVMRPQQPIIFSFSLIKNPGTLNWEYESYDAVEVSIEGQSVPTMDDRMEVTPPAMAFLQHEFPASEDYVLTVRYFSGSTVLAEAGFLVTVQSEKAATLSTLLAALPIAAFVISSAVVAVLLLRRRRETPEAP